MRVLVTGGAGYIGSHTAKALARAGHEPVVFDDLRTGHRSSVKWGQFVHGDLAEPGAIAGALEDHGIEAVIHFAGSAYVGESTQNPRAYFRNNLVNSLALLDAMLDVRIKTIVFSSSCTVYGVPGSTPISETHAQRPVSPYGESKLAVERILQWYGRAYGLKWIALRYFNAAGADLEGDLGEDHDPETHLIPLTILSGMGRRPPIEILGTDYETVDGTAVRDYVHVNDLADAHVRAIAYLRDGGASQAMNLGTGVGHSVREVLKEVEKVGGRPVPFVDSLRREGDVPLLVADTALARRELGWIPVHSDLATIVRSAWAWHLAGAPDRAAVLPEPA